MMAITSFQQFTPHHCFRKCLRKASNQLERIVRFFSEFASSLTLLALPPLSRTAATLSVLLLSVIPYVSAEYPLPYTLHGLTECTLSNCGKYS
jgi:hypothetical protein